MDHQKGFQMLYAVESPNREDAAREILRTVEFILSEDIVLLEKKLAEYVGIRHCVAVSDAASGIGLALQAAGISRGERVLCAALGCAVPVQGILLAGCVPVFVDINPNTYTIDPYCVEYALGKLHRMGEPIPKALIATDLFGAPCNYKALQPLCDQRGITLIEDLSGAFGSRFAGKMTGNFGRFAVASFATPCPLEELGGGAVFCRESRDAERLRSLRRTGKQEFIGELGTALPCMGSADAALIAAKLKQNDALIERRRRVSTAYRNALQGKVRMQQVVAEGESVYSQLVVALPRARSRTLVVERLRNMNAPAHTPICGKQTAYSAWNRVMLVNTLALSDRLLSLPIHPYLSEHVVEHICRCLLRAIDAPSEQLSCYL